jgi:DNA polymerase III subunit epsilon
VKLCLSHVFRPPTIDWDGKYRAKRERVIDPRLQRFYQVPFPDSHCQLKDVKFLAIDFETTGLDKHQDEIITIGMVPFTLQRIFLNQAQHWLVKPRQPLKESSIVIHGITHSDIMGAPDLMTYLDDILGRMEGHIVVAHYHKIERYFLDNAIKNRLGEGIEFPIVDTMAIEERILARTHGGICNWLKGKRRPSVRLGECRQRYSLPAYTAHHALTDAIATAELFLAQVRHHFKEEDTIDRFWL